MALDFKSKRVVFSSNEGIEQKETATFNFNKNVIRAEAVINGFNIQYTEQDRHILQQKIDTRVSLINGNKVDVDIAFLLRDSSGNIDDPYEGTVDVVVIAEI
ncbi:MAG: hypothetical protein AAGF26_12945 [Cyanobacteria bacterium P01_G01_bin.49]